MCGEAAQAVRSTMYRVTMPPTTTTFSPCTLALTPLARRRAHLPTTCQVLEKGKAPMNADAAADLALAVAAGDAPDWADAYDYEDEDEEIEDYYFSSAAGEGRGGRDGAWPGEAGGAA